MRATTVRQAFRFGAPVNASRQALLRPRLVEVLAGRFGRRLTCVIGGAGFGKTTLLAQAIEQNRLDRRGEDVWLGLVAADASIDHLLAGLAGALGISEDAPNPTPESIVGAVWRRAPVEVTLVLDDLHLLADPSPGLDLVVDLVDRLPGNGHLVVASRTAIGRLVDRAEALLVESDLAFDDDELGNFADSRAVDRSMMSASGGWPALAELRAGAGEAVAEDFLWEEILGRLDPWRRDAIERLLAFGSFDDELACAVTGREVSAAELAAGLPLAALDGSAVRLHDLWSRAGSRRRGADAGIRRGADLLQQRGRFREAFDVLDQVGDEDAIAALMERLASRDLPELHADDFAYLLGRAPARVRSGPHAALLRAQMLLAVDGAGARAAVGDAARAFAVEGDVDGEARALAHKLWLHAWDADVAAMGAVFERLVELGAGGNERARRSVDLSSAYMALVSGDPARAVSLIEASTAFEDPTTAPMGGFILASANLDLGQADEALAAAIEARRHARGRLRVGVVGAEFEARLQLGLPEEGTVRVWMDELHELGEAYGVAENRAMVLSGLATVCAEYGWIEEARRHLVDARQAEEVVGARVRPAMTMAEVTLRLADDDEDGAAAVLRDALERDPLGDRPDRAYRRSLASIYVLLPEARAELDDLELGPFFAFGRDLARRVVALRSGDVTSVAGLDWDDVGRLRAALAGPFVVELAVGAVTGGDPEARGALDGLPFDIRAPLRRLAASSPDAVAGVARELLTAVPAPPGSTVEIAVLGPLEVRRDGERVRGPDWQRDRVRALLQFLVDRRSISRRRVAEAVWPDLDAIAAADNLRVNLNHLQRVLQPDRLPEEAPWFIRAADDRLVLHPSAELRVDADDFEAAVAAGRAAESALDPVIAIARYREAIGLYRGDYLVDAFRDDWGEADRARLRGLFVEVAVRAGELLLADGAYEEAATLGSRTVAVDPFAESAHRLSARALRRSGDRAGAWRLLTAAVATLREEGLEPEAQTLEDLRELTDAD